MFASMVLAAALFFTVGGVFMKLSEGLTKFWPTVKKSAAAMTMLANMLGLIPRSARIPPQPCNWRGDAWPGA